MSYLDNASHSKLGALLFNSMLLAAALAALCG
jgi:hypothetical protein